MICKEQYEEKFLSIYFLKELRNKKRTVISRKNNRSLYVFNNHSEGSYLVLSDIPRDFIKGVYIWDNFL